MGRVVLRFGAAARYIGVSPTTFRRWVKAGLVPFLRDPETQTVWFSRESLDLWRAGFKVGS